MVFYEISSPTLCSCGFSLKTCPSCGFPGRTVTGVSVLKENCNSIFNGVAVLSNNRTEVLRKNRFCSSVIPYLLIHSSISSTAEEQGREIQIYAGAGAALRTTTKKRGESSFSALEFAARDRTRVRPAKRPSSIPKRISSRLHSSSFQSNLDQTISVS